MFRRRECWVPTWRGWLVLAILGAGLSVLAVRTIHPFLAVTKPVQAEVLVVEGWAPDYELEAAMAEFTRQGYRKLFVTGGPLEAGAPLSEYKTYAERGAATLLRLGFRAELLQAVPAPRVRQDRTYSSAVALYRWLREHGALPKSLNVMSVGPHARRTRLLFQKALGDGVAVGIIAIESRDYPPAQWWKYSYGVRGVIGEFVAYVYARFFFREDQNVPST